MINPADQPQLIELPRSTDPPTLWVSLALGSVLLHLVFFIIVSVVLTRDAKVQLDVEPIAVEFVDPTAALARSSAPDRAIAARPGKPSSTPPSSTQSQPDVSQQSSSFNQPVEQPFVPQQPAKRKQVPAQPQPQQSNPFRNSIPQQPSLRRAPSQPPSNPPLQQSNRPNPSKTQSPPGANSTPGRLTGSNSDLSPQPTETQKPVESGQGIAQLPQGRSASVVVSNPRQTIFDPQQQPARPIEQQKTVSIDYPDAIAQIPGRSIRIQVTLQINDKGLVVGVGETSLLFPDGGIIKQADLDTIAKQIFETWRFEPAQNASGNALLKPPMSNLIIVAQIQFP